MNKPSSTKTTSRSRSQRAASLKLDAAPWRVWLKKFSSGPAITRMGIALLTAVLITLSVRGWNPPFPYRQGQIPARDLIARVSFETIDKTGTASAKDQAARESICFYENRKALITQLRGETEDQLFGLLGITVPVELSQDQRRAVDEMRDYKSDTESAEFTASEALLALQSILADETEREKIDIILKTVLAPIEENGLLRSLKHDAQQGNQRWIRVFPDDQVDEAVTIDVARVRFAEVATTLKSKLANDFKREFVSEQTPTVSNMVFNYLIKNLPETLTYRQDLSAKVQREAIDAVVPTMTKFQPGVTNLVPSGKPLSADDIEILRAEYNTWLQTELTLFDSAIRLVSFLGMIFALYALCGFFIYYQFDQTLLSETAKLCRLLGLTVFCIIAAAICSQDPLQAQLVPMVLCAITAKIAYGRPFALMLSSALALAITLSLGLDLGELVILTSAASASVLLLDRVRTRTRLIYVGLGTAAICSLTAIGVGIMLGQANGAAVISDTSLTLGASLGPSFELMKQLSIQAFRLGLFAIMASLVMYAMLPVVERVFQVQTDLSLLELGDASHSLLRQLAQRAPGTYNHSINVAAIAEAAAESIGAHGLLTRVGAYFHDIGKMFKPSYFIENQGQGGNRHDSLQPAMSTLVIIAHVKDGADLARQHKLPKPLIDFIEQHHGTTLVEYFYRQATKKSEESPHGEEVSELNFRYPGPKPQSLEAAVLMLSDAVESASRTLVEPTPSRIQNLVDQIAMKRLLDGQFDDCGLTLRQLEKMKQSLVKTLTAIYHGRVKYPDQQTA
jgi:hypothetical protein